jgi:hypothetical protein
MRDSLSRANSRLRDAGIPVRVTGYRMEAGEIKVACVAAGEDALWDSLERLGSPTPTSEIVRAAFGDAGLPNVVPAWHNEATWRQRDSGWLETESP